MVRSSPMVLLLVLGWLGLVGAARISGAAAGIGEVAALVYFPQALDAVSTPLCHMPKRPHCAFAGDPRLPLHDDASRPCQRGPLRRQRGPPRSQRCQATPPAACLPATR